MSRHVVFLFCLLGAFLFAESQTPVGVHLPDNTCEGVLCSAGSVCQIKYCTPYCPPETVCPEIMVECGVECILQPTTVLETS